MTFFVGLHHPGDAKHFARACLSIRALRGRKKPIPGVEAIIDSGAFRELELYGRYEHSVGEYATELHRLHALGVVRILVAVAQDFMCEPFMLRRTGLTVADHQRLTIERYDELKAELARLFDGNPPFPIMPVLQGFRPEEYADHVRAYGDRLEPGAWVGVGSVCKRNGSPEDVAEVLEAIAALRPDLRLHGFGLKVTALQHPIVHRLLSTADSLAWSYAARRQGRDRHSWREAAAFAERVTALFDRGPEPYVANFFG